MNKQISGSGWGRLPAIRLIVSKCVTVGPKGSCRWNQARMLGPYWRIYWNDAPGAFVACHGQEVELTPDRVVVLSPNAVYRTRAECLARHFYTHCFVSQPFSELKGRMFVWDKPELVKLASKLADRVNEHPKTLHTEMQLLVYLNNVLLSISEKEVPRIPAYSSKITKAIELLEGVQTITNGELAEKLGMSRNGLLALFKKETGTSPQNYSRQIRLNEACVMLHHTEKSIDQIAWETGFCDRYHFSRAFRHAIGCPPARFRSQG